MTYYGAKELAASFRTVRANTIKIAEEIGEEHYNFKAAPEAKSVAQILAHAALAPRFPYQIHAVEKVTAMQGFNFPAFFAKLTAEQDALTGKPEILEALKIEGEKFATWLEGLSESFLAETVSLIPGMTPPTKSRFEMILGVKEHEMTHRAQLMLIERILGMVPHMTREQMARMQAMQAAMQSGKATA
jgi:uncharacterized damage-inducible protein DinB